MLLTEGKRFVAFFDLLGFGSWVESSGSKEVFTYVRGFLNLMVRSSLPGSVVHEDMSVDVEESDLGYINFSDSVVFYSRDDSYICLKRMMEVCAEFMNIVICGPSRMLRGAISHGEFYVDPDANAYVGQALIDAYRLEGKQDWLGLSFHKSVEISRDFRRALNDHQGFIVRSLVPLLGLSEKPFCINWANKKYIKGSFNAMRGLDSSFRRGQSALKGNPEELIKLERRYKCTKEFLIYYNDESKVSENEGI